MKILVAVKRVIDYNVQIRVKEDGTGIVTENVKMSTNPPDDNAIEEAVKIKETGKATEVVAITIGEEKAQETVRKALAVGADRGIHVKAEGIVEPLVVAKILQKIVDKEKPDLVFMGKQAIDDDCNQTGQMLAALLNWPQATFASKIGIKDKVLEVVAAMGGERPHYGKDYIIPSTFDPRLISVIPAAVAKAAIKTGVARIKIDNFESYKENLKQRLDPTVTIMQGINSHIKKKTKKVVFADGEDENMLKAAIAFKNSKLGIPILIGKEEKIKEQIKKIGYNENFDIEIINSKDTIKRKKYVQYLFKKLQRKQGMLERDCDRLIRNDRVAWASCMVACNDANAMVTGNTRRYSSSLEKVVKVVDPRPGEIMFGLNLVVNRGKTIFICDTSVIEYPDANQLVDMAISTARVVRLFGFDPKVAFLSHSTFGQPVTDRTKRISDAVEILKKKKVDFKFDGEMQPDVALEEIYKELYPFSEIVGNSNVLIMPSQHSAAISYKMIKSISRAKVIGPLLIGLGLPIEIAPLRSSTSEILNLASIAAYSADIIKYKK